MTAIQAYLERTSPPNPTFLAYLANLQAVSGVSPEIARSIVQELADQRANLKLIASENYCSLPVQYAMGNTLTDKYAEGTPGHRYYSGCDNVDAIENLARDYAMELFGAEHAYVQPHSGADANLIAYWAILATRVEAPYLAEKGQKLVTLSDEDWEVLRKRLGDQSLLGLDFACGGHLTHGFRPNVSAKMFKIHSYVVNPETGLLDYDAIAAQAAAVKPLILLAGYSAYPRSIDFERMRAIADSVGAVLMVDMAHFAGLVAGKVFTGKYDPIAYADVVTTTTHKTLRGPRGGLVLCKEEFREAVDKGCPAVIGGPLPHVIAAKALAFKEALSDEFKTYSAKIVENSRALAEACQAEGMTVVSGGTDNHLLLIDVKKSFGLTGMQAEAAVRSCGITLNRNAIPGDTDAWYTSGLRVGTPAATSLGMGVDEMREIAAVMKQALSATTAKPVKKGGVSKKRYVLDEGVVAAARGRVKAMLDRYPVYPELDLAFLQEHFAS